MSDQNNQIPQHGPAPNQPDEKKLDMKAVTKILKTPSESRTQKQCAELLEQIGDLQFFRQYNEDPTTANVPKLCCKYMEIEQFPDNEIIFEFGSVGNKFYVVLEGSVGVYIKKPPPAQPEAEDKSKPAVNAVQSANLIVDPLADFMRVKVLPEGSSFGELALLNNKPRLATIKCIAPTYVATLSKENFNKILKEHEEQKLNKEIDFFQSVPGFCDLNIKQIRFLCLNNKQIETNKNDVVFDEKEPSDSLFVIKQGEFEVFKLVEKQMDQKEEIMKQNILSFSALNKNSNVKVLKQIKIKVLTVGEMIGEESIIKKSQREFRLVCSSHKGIVIKIKANDFLRKINEEPAVSQAFFKRFTANYEENEQRVQKRVQQFHEFKNYLIEDRVPVKLRISIDKLYSNNNLTLEQKKASISEFRQQAIQFENMQKKSELQTAILSQSAMTQRLSQVNSMTFQNQVQFYKYKRLSLLAADPKNIMGNPSSTSNTTTNIPYINLGSNNAFGSMKDLSKWKQQQQPQSQKAVPPLNLIQSLREIDAEDDSPVSSSRKTQKKDDLNSPKNHISESSSINAAGGSGANPRLSNFSPNTKQHKLNQQDNITSPEITNQMSPKSIFNINSNNNNNRSFVRASLNSPYLLSGNESPNTTADVRSLGLGRTPLDRGAQAARRKLYYQSGINISFENPGQLLNQPGQFQQQANNKDTSILQSSTQNIPMNSNNPGSNSASDNQHNIEQGNTSADSTEGELNKQKRQINSSNTSNSNNNQSRLKHQFSVDSTQNLQNILALENKQHSQGSTSQDPQNNHKDNKSLLQRQSLKLPSNMHRSYSQILPKDSPLLNSNTNQQQQQEYGNSKKYSIYEIHEQPQQILQQQQQYSPELIGGLSKNNPSKLKSNTEFGEVFDGSAASLLNLRNQNKDQFTAFQFNNDKKRQVKTTLLKDNFIRDWKKHQDLPFEDAQQQALIKKIKKITSQTEKFTDYLRTSAHIQELNPNQNNQHSSSNNNMNNFTYSHPLQLHSPTLGIIAGIKQQQQPDNSPLSNNGFNVVSLPKIPEATNSQIQINSIDPSRKLPLSRNSNQLQSSPLIMSVSGAGAMKQSFHPRVHHRQLKKQILVFNQ